MADPKVFDVASPKPADLTAPQVKPARKIMLNEPVLPEPSKSATPEIEEAAKKAEEVIVSRHGADIAPPNDKKVAELEGAPEVTEKTEEPTKESVLPEDIELTNEAAAPGLADEPPLTEKEPEPEPEVPQTELEKQEPIKEIGSIDSMLPDDSQRATAATKDAMQSPTMFDTKAYYVPIGNSQHRHGHIIGAILAGVIAAAVAVGAVLYFAKLI